MNIDVRRTILVADDVAINRKLLQTMFDDKFHVICAKNGEEAIAIIDEMQDALSLILLDIIMPKRTGLEVLGHMKKLDLLDRVPVIVITGASTVSDDLAAYDYGAAEILHKPFSKPIVVKRSLNIIEQYESRHNMERLLKERSRELVESKEKIEKNNEFLINALGSVVEFRSQESGEHVARVKRFSKIILENWILLHPNCGYDKKDIQQMVNASALHDIGKIAIPDAILMKPGRLNAMEFDIMKTHTTVGCDILEHFKQEDNEFYRYCYDICRHHHERYDGKGYPDGLAGEEIPLWAQAVSIVDVYDALISPRVYKAPFTVDEAFRMIQNGECGAFSDDLLACFEYSKQQIIEATGGFGYGM